MPRLGASPSSSSGDAGFVKLLPPAVAIETHECNCELVLDWWREQLLREKHFSFLPHRLSSQEACFSFSSDVAAGWLIDVASAADLQRNVIWVAQ